MVKSTTLAAAALAATSASALNTFRHGHERKVVAARRHPLPHQHQARDIVYRHTETEVVTEWVTVYVTAGDEPTSTDTAAAEDPTTFSSPAVLDTPPSSYSVEEAGAPTSATPEAEPTTSAADVVVEAAAEPSPEAQTTTSAAAAATSSATSSSGGSSSSTGKRGLAYNSATIAETFVSTGSFSWAYNWGCTTNAQSTLGVEYCPMLWGQKNDMLTTWQACAQASIDAGSTHLLSFNEPDGTTDPANQAQMSAEDAAKLHNQYMNQFSGSAKIGAPAITSDVGNTASSVSWLKSFFEKCNAIDGGCAVDFCPVHWYGSVASGADNAVTLLKEFLNTASSACGGKPLWLTEYGLTDGSESDIADFISKSSAMLDSFSGLDRYSYFFVDGTLSTSGSINSLGQTYASS